MLEDLRAIVELADAGSVVKAADRLCRTPSAVTRKVQRLETVLGAPLLDRTVKPPRLTALGMRVVAQGREMLRRADDLRQLTSPASEPHGLLRLGVSHALANAALVGPIRELSLLYPHLQVHLASELTPTLFARLQKGEIDAAIALLPEGCSAPLPLTSNAIAHDDMVIVGSNELIADAEASWDGLAGKPWVLNPPGCLLRAILLETMAHAGAPASIAVEIHNFDLQLSFVAGGHGLGFVPLRFLRRSSHATALRIMPIPQFGLRMSAMFAQAGHLGALQRAVGYLETEIAREIGDSQSRAETTDKQGAD